ADCHKSLLLEGAGKRVPRPVRIYTGHKYIPQHVGRLELLLVARRARSFPTHRQKWPASLLVRQKSLRRNARHHDGRCDSCICPETQSRWHRYSNWRCSGALTTQAPIDLVLDPMYWEASSNRGQLVFALDRSPARQPLAEQQRQSEGQLSQIQLDNHEQSGHARYWFDRVAPVPPLARCD